MYFLTMRAIKCIAISATIGLCSYSLALAKDCRYPAYPGGQLVTPTRNSSNWDTSFLNFGALFDVVRSTVDDFTGDEALFTDFEDICVYVHRENFHGEYSGMAVYDGFIPERGRIRIHHREIHVRTNTRYPYSYVVTLHEIGHHITMPLRLGRSYTQHKEIAEKTADFWAGAIMQRLHKLEPSGIWDIERFISNFVWKDNPQDFWRREVMREGWRQAGYGDTVFLYYGTYDIDWLKRCTYLCDPNMTRQYSISPGPFRIADPDIISNFGRNLQPQIDW